MADLSLSIGKYFKTDKFEGPKEFTIDHAQNEEVGMDEDVQLKPVLYFEEDPRGLVLNTTRYDDISEALQTRDVEKWKGMRVRVTVSNKKKFNGYGTFVIEVLPSK